MYVSYFGFKSDVVERHQRAGETWEDVERVGEGQAIQPQRGFHGEAPEELLISNRKYGTFIFTLLLMVVSSCAKEYDLYNYILTQFSNSESFCEALDGLPCHEALRRP